LATEPLSINISQPITTNRLRSRYGRLGRLVKLYLSRRHGRFCRQTRLFRSCLGNRPPGPLSFNLFPAHSPARPSQPSGRGSFEMRIIVKPGQNRQSLAQPQKDRYSFGSHPFAHRTAWLSPTTRQTPAIDPDLPPLIQIPQH